MDEELKSTATASSKDNSFLSFESESEADSEVETDQEGEYNGLSRLTAVSGSHSGIFSHYSQEKNVKTLNGKGDSSMTYSVRQSTSRFDSDDEGYSQDEEYSNSRTKNKKKSRTSSIVRHVPLVENIVMGKTKTVEDEEHTRERGCCMDIMEEFDNYNEKDRLHSRSLRARILIPIMRLVSTIIMHFADMTPKQKKVYTLGIVVTSFLMGYQSIMSNQKYNLSKNEGFLRAEKNHNIPSVSDFIGEDTNNAASKKMVFNIERIKNPPHPPNDVMLPTNIEENLLDIGLPRRSTDVPLFWHVPRSAGSTMKEIMGSCFNLVLAADEGAFADRVHTSTNAMEEDKNVINVKKQKQFLEIVQHRDGIRYINVDTTRNPGIARAKSLGLVESELAQVIVSVFAQDASMLFGNVHKGRLFTIFRHPVERNISLFHYLGWAVWEPTHDPKLTLMTVDEYARRPRREYNWMTRSLIGHWNGELTQMHLDIAKSIIKRKCLVGLIEEKEETLRRFELFFNWDRRNRKESKCRNNLLNEDWPNRYAHEPVQEGSHVWELLEKQNAYDMELYYYAKKIFEEQASLFE